MDNITIANSYTRIMFYMRFKWWVTGNGGGVSRNRYHGHIRFEQAVFTPACAHGKCYNGNAICMEAHSSPVVCGRSEVFADEKITLSWT